MTTIKVEKQDSVFVLTMTNGDHGNVLNDGVLDEFHHAFDDLEKSRGDASLIITSNHDKSFSNGIDLPWLMQQRDMLAFIRRLEGFYVRLALLNMPVIAAINGNAYAGGALLATACDMRLMREDRGRFCYSEVKVKMPFTNALLDIVRLLPNPAAVYELALTGSAWGGGECERRNVVNQALPADQLMPAALKQAAAMASLDRTTYTTIKRGLRPAIMALQAQRASDE